MHVIVRDRGEGKTPALIEWLLRGHEIDHYPGWSRVIVCTAGSAEVVRVGQIVQESTQAELDSVRARGNLPAEARRLHDLRKAVWSIRDLQFNARGVNFKDVDYAIDDVDILINSTLGVYKGPELVTITGTSGSLG